MTDLPALILSVLPPDMDHRIEFADIFRAVRAAGAGCGYVEASDALDALVADGKAVRWEGDPDDRVMKYSLPQEWEDPDPDYTAAIRRAEAAEAEVDRLRAPLPCGHPAACVVSSPEGTAYCGWCEDVGRARHTEEVLVARVEVAEMERDVLRADHAETLERVREVVADLERRGRECRRMTFGVENTERDRERLTAKATTYEQAVRMLAAALEGM